MKAMLGQAVLAWKTKAASRLQLIMWLSRATAHCGVPAINALAIGKQIRGGPSTGVAASVKPAA